MSETPRIVQIGLNLISLLDVNDKMHYFEGNVLTHVFWDAAALPSQPKTPFFRPWIQLHNVKSVEEIQNAGMQSWPAKELAKKVREDQQGNANKPVMVMETRNFVARFVSELNLRHFPFDHQSLRITIMCNMTKDVTFTHKVKRDMDRTRNPTLAAEPMVKDGKVINTIKCNLEADTLSEWDVLLQDGRTLDSSKTTHLGEPALAVAHYTFKEHDKTYSAEGSIYQRLDFQVYVKRELRNMMSSIIVPTALLSASAVSVFSLDILDTRGERLGVLFTLILTIIANQFVTQNRLPYLAYFTWLDMTMLLLQAFVYFVVIETAVVQSIAETAYQDAVTDELIRQADMVGMYLSIALFVAIGAFCSITAWHAIKIRNAELVKAEAEAKESYAREEERLHNLWFPKKEPESAAPKPRAESLAQQLLDKVGGSFRKKSSNVVDNAILEVSVENVHPQ